MKKVTRLLFFFLLTPARAGLSSLPTTPKTKTLASRLPVGILMIYWSATAFSSKVAKRNHTDPGRDASRTTADQRQHWIKNIQTRSSSSKIKGWFNKKPFSIK
jgi:hypothetical protein